MRDTLSALFLALSLSCAGNADESQFSSFAESTSAPYGGDRRDEPVFGEDAGGIHVFESGDELALVIESCGGMRWATGSDGITWKSRGLLYPKDSDSPHGHVTPFVLSGSASWRLFYGAARAETWDQNSIYSTVLNPPAP